MKKFYAKFLEIFITWSGTFSTNISETLQKYFSYDYKKNCANTPTIITKKVAETFLKYFVPGLKGGYEKFTKYFCKFSESYIEIFHRSSMLRHLKHYTISCRMLYAKFFETLITWSGTFSTNIFETLQKYFSYDYKKNCANTPTIITKKVAETFLKYFVHGLKGGYEKFTKYF